MCSAGVLDKGRSRKCRIPPCKEKHLGAKKKNKKDTKKQAWHLDYGHHEENEATAASETRHPVLRNKAQIAQLGHDVLVRTLRSGSSSQVPVRRGRRNPRSPSPSLRAAGGQRCGPGEEEEESGSRARRSGPTEGAGDPPGPGARTWPRKWVAGSGVARPGPAAPRCPAPHRSAPPPGPAPPAAPPAAGPWLGEAAVVVVAKRGA